jgi:hypothetical protein
MLTLVDQIFRYIIFVRHGLGMIETFSELRRGRQRWEAGSLNIATTLKQELANLEVQDQLRARTLISSKLVKTDSKYLSNLVSLYEPGNDGYYSKSLHTHTQDGSGQRRYYISWPWLSSRGLKPTRAAPGRRVHSRENPIREVKVIQFTCNFFLVISILEN